MVSYRPPRMTSNKARLIYAVSNGKDGALRKLLRSGRVDVNMVLDGIDVKEFTMLHLACWHGRAQIANTLLDFHANANTKAADETTPLHVACTNNHIGVVKILLRRNVEVNIQNAFGNTALHIACEYGFQAIVKELLVSGKADATLRNIDGITPLQYACFSGNSEVVRSFLEETDVDATAKNDWGITPIHTACYYGHVEIIQMLLVEGHADAHATNKDGFTPLFPACIRGHLEVVRSLIVEGQVDVLRQTNDGETSFFCACRYGHVDIVKLLYEHEEAVMNLRDVEGWTPLHAACHGGHLEVVRFLLECAMDLVGVKCSNASTGKLTPLHIAAQFGHLDIVKALQACNGDIFDADGDGNTPFDHACWGDKPVVVDHLLDCFAKQLFEEHGLHTLHAIFSDAEFEPDADGTMAQLSLLGRLGKIQGIHMAHLLTAIMDGTSNDLASSRNENGALPLHLACLAGVPVPALKVIVEEYDAPLRLIDDNGDRPLDIAINRGASSEVIKFLETETQNVATAVLLRAIERQQEAAIARQELYGQQRESESRICENEEEEEDDNYDDYDDYDDDDDDEFEVMLEEVD